MFQSNSKIIELSVILVKSYSEILHALFIAGDASD